MKPLYEADGPCVTVHLDVNRSTADALQQLDSRWTTTRHDVDLAGWMSLAAGSTTDLLVPVDRVGADLKLFVGHERVPVRELTVKGTTENIPRCPRAAGRSRSTSPAPSNSYEAHYEQDVAEALVRGRATGEGVATGLDAVLDAVLDALVRADGGGVSATLRF